MSLEKLNTWLTLVANLGVLAGIVILAVEISQNTRALNAAALNDIQDDILELVSVDVDAVSFSLGIDEKIRNGELLSDMEAEIHLRKFIRAMRIHESHWFQYDSGLLDEELYEAYKIHWNATAYMHESIYRSEKESMVTNGLFHPGFAQAFIDHIDNSPPFSRVRPDDERMKL